MILLTPNIKKQLDGIVNNPVHGILLAGSEGAGKLFTARMLVSRVLRIEQEKLDYYPYFRLVSPDGNTISIEQIRELKAFIRLKTIGRNKIRRAVIIEDAHTMSISAQNALLKTLEEPPADTIIILTAPNSSALKDTIYSRVRKVYITTAEKGALRKAFASEASEAEINSAYLFSGGRVGLFASIIRGDDSRLAETIKTAKNIMAMNTHSRLVQIDEIVKQKEGCREVLAALSIIAAAALENTADRGDAEQVAKWHRIVSAIDGAQTKLRYNANAKLLLSDLFLTL